MKNRLKKVGYKVIEITEISPATTLFEFEVSDTLVRMVASSNTVSIRIFDHEETVSTPTGIINWLELHYEDIKKLIARLVAMKL